MMISLLLGVWLVTAIGALPKPQTNNNRRDQKSVSSSIAFFEDPFIAPGTSSFRYDPSNEAKISKSPVKTFTSAFTGKTYVLNGTLLIDDFKDTFKSYRGSSTNYKKSKDSIIDPKPTVEQNSQAKEKPLDKEPSPFFGTRGLGLEDVALGGSQTEISDFYQIPIAPPLSILTTPKPTSTTQQPLAIASGPKPLPTQDLPPSKPFTPVQIQTTTEPPKFQQSVPSSPELFSLEAGLNPGHQFDQNHQGPPKNYTCSANSTCVPWTICSEFEGWYAGPCGWSGYRICCKFPTTTTASPVGSAGPNPQASTSPTPPTGTEYSSSTEEIQTSTAYSSTITTQSTTLPSPPTPPPTTTTTTVSTATPGTSVASDFNVDGSHTQSQGYKYPTPPPGNQLVLPERVTKPISQQIEESVNDGGNIPAKSLEQGSCPAAMVCVQRFMCSLTGEVVKDMPNIDEAYRQVVGVPLRPCKISAKNPNFQPGIELICCRDPLYMDPWPSTS